jgi:hypothetical protein
VVCWVITTKIPTYPHIFQGKNIREINKVSLVTRRAVPVDGATHQEQLLLEWVCLRFKKKNPIRWTRRQTNHFHALQSRTTIRTHVDAPAHVPPTSIVTVNRNALHERGENKLGTIFLLGHGPI